MRALLSVLVIVLVLLVSSVSFAQVQFGLTGDINPNYFAGVMGGATQAGSGIARHAYADDNIVISRATLAPLPVLLPILSAQVTPSGGVILPPVLLVSPLLPPDPGAVPFSLAGTLATQGAYP